MNEDVKVVVRNRKARHEYEIVETLEAGLVLTGTEVKSLRNGDANLQDSYASIKNGEALLFKMHISPYKQGSVSNHEPMRTRKLLLHKAQLRKLQSKTREKGFTLIPLTVYFKGPFAKLELALARGKRKFDKREAIAERETKRRIEQTKRRMNRLA